MNITACIIARNEGHCIGDLIVQIHPFVSEVIVVDDHSTDDTVLVSNVNKAIVKPLPFVLKDKGFAFACNWMMDQIKTEWYFEIDADELLDDAPLLQTLVRYPDKNVWALPRRKWEKFPLVREEYEAYPDWQTRLIRKGSGRFEGEMHKHWVGDRVYYAYNGPHIEHRQTEMRTKEKMKNIRKLYPRLAELQGVHIVGGHVKTGDEK